MSNNNTLFSPIHVPTSHQTENKEDNVGIESTLSISPLRSPFKLNNQLTTHSLPYSASPFRLAPPPSSSSRKGKASPPKLNTTTKTSIPNSSYPPELSVLTPHSILQHSALSTPDDVQSIDFCFHKQLSSIIPFSTSGTTNYDLTTFTHLHTLKLNDTSLFTFDSLSSSSTTADTNVSLPFSKSYHGTDAIMLLSLFPRLRALSLVCNDISVWPNSSEFENLYQESLNTKLLSSSSSLLRKSFQFTNLRTLDLSFNRLGTGPGNPLSESNNSPSTHDYTLSNLTALVSSIPNIISLNLSHNNLLYIPACIKHLQRLETFILDSNHLSLANDWIVFSQLPNLITLSLARNYYIGIPQNIFKIVQKPFSSLTTLSLAYNYLPASTNMNQYFQIPKLSSLALYGTPCALACTDMQSRIKVADDNDIHHSQITYLHPPENLLEKIVQDYQLTGQVNSQYGQILRTNIHQSIHDSQSLSDNSNSIITGKEKISPSTSSAKGIGLPFSHASKLDTSTSVPVTRKIENQSTTLTNNHHDENDDDAKSTTSSKRFIPRARAALDVAISTMARMSRSRATTPTTINTEASDIEEQFIDITMGISDRAKLHSETIASVKSLAHTVTADNKLRPGKNEVVLPRAFKFILVDPATDPRKNLFPNTNNNRNLEISNLGSNDSIVTTMNSGFLPSIDVTIPPLASSTEILPEKTFIPKARAALSMTIHSISHSSSNINHEAKLEESPVTNKTSNNEHHEHFLINSDSPNFLSGTEYSMMNSNPNHSLSSSPLLFPDNSLSSLMESSTTTFPQPIKTSTKLANSSPLPIQDSSVHSSSSTKSISSRRYAVLSQFPLSSTVDNTIPNSSYLSGNRMISSLSQQEQSILDAEPVSNNGRDNQFHSVDAKFVRHQRKRKEIREATGRGYYSEGIYSSPSIPDFGNIDPLDVVGKNESSFFPSTYAQSLAAPISAGYVNEQQIAKAKNLPLTIVHKGLRGAMEAAFQEYDNPYSSNTTTDNPKFSIQSKQTITDNNSDASDPLHAFRREYAKSLEDMGMHDMANTILQPKTIFSSSSLVATPSINPTTLALATNLSDANKLIPFPSSGDTLSTADSSSQMLSGYMVGASTARSFFASTKDGNGHAMDSESMRNPLETHHTSAKYRSALSGLKQAIQSDSSTYTGIYSMRTLGPTALQRARQKPKRSYLTADTIGVEFEKSIQNIAEQKPDKVTDGYNVQTIPEMKPEDMRMFNDKNTYEISTLDSPPAIVLRPSTVHSITRSVSNSIPTKTKLSNTVSNRPLSHLSQGLYRPGTKTKMSPTKHIILEPLPPRSAIDALRTTRLHPGGISAPLGKPGYFGVQTATHESQLSLQALSSLLHTVEDMGK